MQPITPITERLAALDQLVAELNALRPLEPTAEAKVMQKLRLDWNYHSNATEGNQLTQGETRQLLLEGITANGKPLKDHNEMRGHNEVIESLEAIVKNQEPLTEVLIRGFHKLLLVEEYEIDAITPEGMPTRRRISLGQYKQQPNHVRTQTGEIHYYATPEETPAKMHELMQWYREREELRDMHPVVLSAEFHYRFVAIHPFDDGNGRLSRILMNLLLMRHSYPIAVIRTSEKRSYLDALQTADYTDSMSPFYEVIISAVIRTTTTMLKAARGEDYREPDEISDVHKELQLIKIGLKDAPSLKNKNNILDTKNVLDRAMKFEVEMIYKQFEPFFEMYVDSAFSIQIIGRLNQELSNNISDYHDYAYPKDIKELESAPFITISGIHLHVSLRGLKHVIKQEIYESLIYKYEFNTYIYKFFTESLLERRYETSVPYGQYLNLSTLKEVVEEQGIDLLRRIKSRLEVQELLKDIGL